MSVLRWEDPPAHGNIKPKKPLKYQDVSDELRAKPHIWALIVDGMSTGGAGALAHSIRIGQRPWDGPGRFESRTVGALGAKSGAKVYARYVGETP